MVIPDSQAVTGSQQNQPPSIADFLSGKLNSTTGSPNILNSTSSLVGTRIMSEIPILIGIILVAIILNVIIQFFLNHSKKIKESTGEQKEENSALVNERIKLINTLLKYAIWAVKIFAILIVVGIAGNLFNWW